MEGLCEGIDVSPSEEQWKKIIGRLEAVDDSVPVTIYPGGARPWWPEILRWKNVENPDEWVAGFNSGSGMTDGTAQAKAIGRMEA